jgi:hypothetical protein
MHVVRGTGTHGPIYVGANSGNGYDDGNNITTPAIIRSRRGRTEPAVGSRSGSSSASTGTTYDIPAFLRRQAD